MFSTKAVNLPASNLAYSNKVFVSNKDYQALLARYSREPVLIELNGFVLVAQKHDSVQEGIAMSKFQREMAKISLVDSLQAKLYTPPDDFYLSSVELEIEVLVKKGRKIEVQEEELEAKFRDNLGEIVLNTNQLLLMDYQGVPLQVKVKKMTLVDLKLPKPEDQAKPCSMGLLHSQSSMQFETISHDAMEILSSKLRTMNIFEGPSFNFEQLGIGGLDQEFSLIFRRAFASRLFPAQVMNRLGIKHVKGMLLYGPPGTGKTLIARQIAKCLRAREPKIINGPEVFNKYVGQTEENIRELFKEAEKEQEEKGDKSQLHIIIFDEIDAICKPRGTISGSTGVHDTVVNQLLSKIDGVNALNNILIIGMTNRKDMIDEAVLRPGRLEVHVEVGLPEEDGRQQILRIHTKQMKDSGALASDVDISELAHMTKNYSGAEIEALVKCAASYAFNRQIDMDNLGKEVNVDEIKICMQDFLSAFKDVQPQFGVDKEDIERFMRGGIINYGQTFQNLYHTCQMLVNQVRTSEHTPLLSLLLEGTPGAGKTALAAKLAIESGFPYVKVITPETYVGYTESGKVTSIAKVFDDAYRSPLSLIVLDNIERLIDFVSIGPRFSNTILQAILVLTNKVPPHPGRRIMIIGTTSNARLLDDLELVKTFNVVMEVKKLSAKEEIAAVLGNYTIDESTKLDISENLSEVSLKQLMLAAEMSLQGHNKIRASKFFECLNSITL